MTNSDDVPPSSSESLAALGGSTSTSTSTSTPQSNSSTPSTSNHQSDSPGSGSQSRITSYTALSKFSFPRAAQPEIVRAYQKDVYYKDLLQSQVKDVVRSIFGTRFLHSSTELIGLIGSLTYYSLSSLGGSQTLGEEYVNAMMTESRTGRIVGTSRRALFIVLHVLAPFLLTRIYSSLRRFILRTHAARTQAAQRAKMRAMALRSSRRSDTTEEKEERPGRIDRTLAYLANKLPEMSSITATDGWLAYAGAAHIAIFYLGGRYYGVAQRLAGVEYISTIPPRPGARLPSYEVLGVLLATQLTVKFGMAANNWRLSRQTSNEENDSPPTYDESEQESSQVQKLSDSVKLDGRTWSHSSFPATLTSNSNDPDKHRGSAPLSYPSPDSKPSVASLGLPKNAPLDQINAARAAAQGKAAELEAIGEGVLKCTLCMDTRTPEKGNSAVTECGHVFCWDCIMNWAEEKPECPLCRQSISPNRLLPVYNF